MTRPGALAARLVATALAAGVASLVAWGGCNPKEAVPCATNPLVCAAGEACALNAASTRYECVRDDPNRQVGATCTPTHGSSPCGDGLACVARWPSTRGVCRAFCGASLGAAGTGGAGGTAGGAGSAGSEGGIGGEGSTSSEGAGGRGAAAGAGGVSGNAGAMTGADGATGVGGNAGKAGAAGVTAGAGGAAKGGAAGAKARDDGTPGLTLLGEGSGGGGGGTTVAPAAAGALCPEDSVCSTLPLTFPRDETFAVCVPAQATPVDCAARGGDECVACCQARYDTGAATFDDLAREAFACLCTDPSGPCVTACAETFCAATPRLDTSSGSCDACDQATNNGRCNPLAGCNASPSCAPYAACISACGGL